MNNLLIIDQDRSLRDSVTRFFRGRGFGMDQAGDFRSAIRSIERNLFDIIVSDVVIPGGSFFDFLDREQRRNSNSMIIVSSERKTITDALRAMRAGCYDFIQKPFGIPELEIKVERAVEHRRLRQETDSLRGERNIIYRAENFIGESPQIKNVFKIVDKVARSNSSVLLTGETGTGKELIAGAIHYNSHRKDCAFVKVNCAALPEQILESELFGHEKGAFTGADKQRIGRFEQADGGTIFLDEIGDMSLATQAKLLRVLQEKEFQRVGSNQTIKVDVRIISATNKDLLHEIQEGRFRSDLFYRLNVVSINIPPLRERRGDILLLTYFFIKKFSGDLKKKVKELHPLAIRHLTEYSWPGNIRELENTIERAVLLADGEVITRDDLHLTYETGLSRWDPGSIRIPSAGISLEEVEKQLVLQALKMCDWVQKDAAKLLNVSERVLNYKIQRFGITHPRWKVNR
ncbi:MAG: sigma-54-dependent transcriptional regulator [Spirochaetota bacterium]